MNAKCQKCISSKCQTAQTQSQTPSSNPTKIQTPTFYQNPKGTNLLSKMSRNLPKLSKEDLAKIWKIQSLLKAVKER